MEVEILTDISNEKLFELYKSAKVLVVPSLVEGFCLPALEAASLGVPVVGFSIEKCSGAIGSGGCLCKGFRFRVA